MKRLLKSKPLALGLFLSIFMALNVGYASAHVVVRPDQVLTGAYQTFTTSVPNEKDIPVTGLRLVMPASVQSVTPTVKSGWEIQTKKSGDTVTEITWTGGNIGAGLRDDFSFSAQAPTEAGDIVWKAYQTYQDGSVVSWDQKPADEHSHSAEESDKGPYSTTIVSDDLETDNSTRTTSVAGAYLVAGIALVVALFVLVKSKKIN